jgi:surface carbohydrate biosynthesis protein
MKTKVLFVTTYIVRDLIGNTLVGYTLERKYNFEIKYTNAYDIKNKIIDFNPDILIMDHLTWNFKVKELEFAKNFNIYNIILPTEGLIFKDEIVLSNSGIQHKSYNYIDLYLFWAERQFNTIKKQNLFEDSKLKICGVPRFDFYNSKFDFFSLSNSDFREKYGINNNNPIVLWSTNTPYAGWDKNEIIRRYITRSDFDENYISNYYDDNNNQFDKHSNIIIRLAKDFPNLNFVIKIHPAEKIKHYEDFFQKNNKFSNIYIEYKDPILPFLKNANLLLHRNCTTAAEFWMLNKTTFQLEFNDFKVGNDSIYYSLNQVFNDYEHLKISIQQFFEGNYIDDYKSKKEEFISFYFYKIDGNSHLRVAENIFENFTKYNSKIDSNQRALLLNDLLKKENSKIKNRILSILRGLLGLTSKQSLRFWKKDKPKDKTVGEVEPDVNTINSNYETFDKFLKY